MIASEGNLMLARGRRLVHVVLGRMAGVSLAMASWAASSVMGADELTGEPDYVVVKASRVITVGGEEYAPGVIVIEDGKISAVGKDLEYPSSAKVIRVGRQTVMPGFVLARSRFGLSGYRRSGVHGDQKAADEVYLSEVDWHDLLEAGYTSVAIVPDGKGVTGMAALYRTAGDDVSRQLAESAYLHVAPAWSGSGRKNLRDALKKAEEEIEKVEKARKEWEEKQKAEAEKKKLEEEKKEETPEEEKEENGGDGVNRAKGDDGENGEEQPEKEKKANGKNGEPKEFEPPKIDPKYQPLVDLINKEEGASMMVELDRASDLLHLDAVLELYDELEYFVYLRPGWSLTSDFHHAVKRLGERKARVVLGPVLQRLPYTSVRCNLMKELTDAGCEVSVVPRRDDRVEVLRLRQRLADLVRSGLSTKAALASLTLHPARAIGFGDRLGSIEKGKDADLVFFDGDPLDPHSKIERVMILGETVWEAE
ncbi:MAG: amidohydrolase family protein [Planctomycetes bacterium]|nr:amidohydrolase family protein [Planctomycetota bacterium]